MLVCSCILYHKINNNIVKDITCNKYYFVTNNILMKVVKLVVDTIRRLELNNFILAYIFKELIHIYYKLSLYQVPINNFQKYILTVINKYIREFESNIYFIAFFIFYFYFSTSYSQIIFIKYFS